MAAHGMPAAERLSKTHTERERERERERSGHDEMNCMYRSSSRDCSPLAEKTCGVVLVRLQQGGGGGG
eukprot:COSAG06_NODE_30732_length_533_cov_1.103687_1_plen_67_part_10